MVVEVERVVADEERGRRVLGDGVLDGEALYVVGRHGAVAAPEDDLEQRVRGRALGRQRDAVVLDLLDGLSREKQDALDGAVGRDAGAVQDVQLVRVARVENG